jgi:hypothetical protein
MQREAYTVKGCTHCLIYNQWMGTVQWSPQMPYLGKNNWTAIVSGDPYNDRDGTVDQRDARYLGGAAEFTASASKWLQEHNAHLRQPDPYHAKSCASMLMLQMAMELAPGADGGLTVDKLTGDQSALNTAMGALDVNTFWGRIKLDHHSGFNTGFQMGIAQFQAHGTVLDKLPTLVGPDSLVQGHTAAKAIYPAEWPCDLKDTCDITEGWTLWEVIGAWFLGVACVLVAVATCYVQRDAIAERKESFLGRGPRSTDPFFSRNTDSLLRENALSNNWYAAGESGLDPSPDSLPPGLFPDGSTRQLRRQDSPAKVLFRDRDVGHLKPRGSGGGAEKWREQVLGKGSYGTVYRATWKGKEVAVKELQVPEEHPNMNEKEREVFIKKAHELRDEFIKELKVSCDRKSSTQPACLPACLPCRLPWSSFRAAASLRVCVRVCACC